MDNDPGGVRNRGGSFSQITLMPSSPARTPVLSMEEGVVFNGTLEMKPQAKVEVLRDTDAHSTSMTSRPPIRLAA